MKNRLRFVKSGCLTKSKLLSYLSPSCVAYSHPRHAVLSINFGF